MAWEKNRIKSGPLAYNGESGAIISTDNSAGKIKNMNRTTTNTLRSVSGPVEYVPSKYQGGQDPALVYGDPLLGIFHCTVNGGTRDIILAHFTDDAGSSNIFEYKGWSKTWVPIVGPKAVALYVTDLPQADKRSRFLTQFEATPNGVVIVPQGGRAYFYDGEVVAPLGYSDVPGPPQVLGPMSTSTLGPVGGNKKDVNNLSAYSHTGQSMNQIMGSSRIGDIDPSTVVSGSVRVDGTLLEGEWRGAVQFLDKWGNVSPLSGLSESAKVVRQSNPFDVEDSRVERLKVQFCWVGIPKGRDATIGRILCRTRDLKIAGTTQLFEVPNYSGTGLLSYASMPDNSGSMFPDNVPDTWLLKIPIDPDPVPNFKLCRLAFGRLWIANWTGGEGVIRPSSPLFWGTFPKNQEIIPDPSGSQITGLWNCNFGLLAFTESSTFLITPNSDGKGFKAAVLNNRVGCVSPDSLGTLPSGLTVWLADDGFYAFDGKAVKRISQDISDNVIRRINKGSRSRACAAVDMTMGEYRCGIPVDGSKTNNLTAVYDATGWRERDDVKMQAVCVTRDHRSYMLALGYCDIRDTAAPADIDNLASVWVLDHNGRGVYESRDSEGLVETQWLQTAGSFRRSTPLRVRIWLRETTKGDLSIEVFRDWRENPAVETAVSPKLYPTDDPPPFWNETILGGTHIDKLRPTSEGQPIANAWSRRRPHWVVADMMVPAAEVYKFRMKYTGDWELVAIVFERLDSDGGGAKIPRGGSSGS